MGTGGSRYGAGRPASHVKAEHCRSLDVRRFAAEKLLRAGSWTWQWLDAATGERVASITVFGGEQSIVLHYSANSVPVRTEVRIIKTPCNYGGARPWFMCPRCGRRVAKLYLRSRYFECRHCHRLSYASQSDDAMGRAWRKQHKVEAKLGEDWQRPKFMHHSTHEKLMDVISQCEEQRDRALVAFVMTHFPHILDR